ncbi:DEAD/DEAH box helicase family protein [Candidatus Pelagibacter sp.]|nr:DEAD/DEAH box helicase family protein [Candidatus Pelagibacter sp.]
MNKINTILKTLGNEGKDFEILSKWYLENEPKFKKIFKKVWLFKDFPKRWGRDTGTDLICETLLGEYWAVQAKNYDKKYYISKSDVDSFLSDTSRKLISRRLIIATTNHLGKNALNTIYQQEKPVHLELLDSLEKAQVNWPLNILNLKPSKIKKHTPWDWQSTGINKILDGLKKDDKGKVIMACGSGKTEMGIWISEKLKSKKTLVLVPTIYLMTQTIDRWCSQASKNFEFLPVCSDKTVVNKDSIINSVSEVALPTTTNKDIICKFLQKNKNLVIFSTYDSLPKIIESVKNNSTKFDLIIADEAHRTASAKKSRYSLVHEKDLLPRKKTLYMTATPRIHSPALKKQSEISGVYLNSMDDDIYGKTLFKLSFYEAVKKKILTDYRILIIGYETKDYKNFVNKRSFLKFKNKFEEDAKSLALKFSLIKSFKKYGSKKTLSFHTRLKSSKRFSNQFNYLGETNFLKSKGIKEYWSKSIEGTLSAFDKKNIINQFKNNSNKTFSLLTNARCLTEGIDVPKIDTICFLDPRQSQVDIAQAVGRVMRKVEGKSIGNLIIPIPVSAKDNIEEKLYKSEYREIFAVTNAMRDHDEELSEVLEEFRKGLKTKTSNRKKLGKIVIDLPNSVSNNFYKELKLKIVDRTTSLSSTMISMIGDYKKKFDHLNFSEKDKAPYNKLFKWVDLMRTLNRINKVPLWIKDELNNIKGFSWRVNGQTLDNIEGLLTEYEFGKYVGFRGIRKLREQNLIKPKGFYPTMGKSDKSQIYEKRLSAYYSKDQKKDLSKEYIKKFSTDNFITKNQALLLPGISERVFEKEKFKPIAKGKARKGSKITDLYDKKEITDYHNKLLKSLIIPGTNIVVPTRHNDMIKLEKEHDIFTETSAQKLLGKKGKERIKLSSLIKPLYHKEGFITLYKKKDVELVKEYRANLKKYLNEMDIRRMGLTNISRYRERKQINPDSEYYPNTFIGDKKKSKPLYLKETIQKFLDDNDVTILDKNNYFTRKDLEKKVGHTNIRKLIKFKIVLAAGKGITHNGFSDLYDKKQVKIAKEAIKIAKRLGFLRDKKLWITEKNYQTIKEKINL